MLRQGGADGLVAAVAALAAPEVAQQGAVAVVVVVYPFVEHAPVVKVAGLVEQRIAGVGEVGRQGVVRAGEDRVAVLPRQVVPQGQQGRGRLRDTHGPPVVAHGFQRVDAGGGQRPIPQRGQNALFKHAPGKGQPLLRREGRPDQVVDAARRQRGAGGAKVRMPGDGLADDVAVGVPAVEGDKVRQQLLQLDGAAPVALHQVFQPQRIAEPAGLLVHQAEVGVQGFAAVDLLPGDEGLRQQRLRVCRGLFVAGPRGGVGLQSFAVRRRVRG